MTNQFENELKQNKLESLSTAEIRNMASQAINKTGFKIEDNNIREAYIDNIEEMFHKGKNEAKELIERTTVDEGLKQKTLNCLSPEIIIDTILESRGDDNFINEYNDLPGNFKKNLFTKLQEMTERM